MRRILVVDDDPKIQRALEQLLTEQGHAAIAAFSAEEALVQMRRCPPSVVILDIGLPAMNGLQALEIIRQTHPRLPVIFLSGQGSPQAWSEAQRLGAFACRQKPFDPESMLALIEEAIGRGPAGIPNQPNRKGQSYVSAQR